MRKIILVIFFVFVALWVVAQVPDSLRSPYSVYGGAGIGTGLLLGGFGSQPLGYDELQFEQKPYVDFQLKVGALWKERYGVAILAGQLGGTNDGEKYQEYASTALDGYRLLLEYSDLHYGYTYRYFTPQFIYRVGREPFNFTLNAGAGIGSLKSANGVAIYQQDSSNNFVERRYYAEPSWNMNFALGLDFAYMRQLSQHWFMNAGINIGYLAIKQNYDINSSSQAYQQPFAIPSTSHIDGVIHHASLGVFVHFQWNTKEYERAYYE